jgi:hypothetical protein
MPWDYLKDFGGAGFGAQRDALSDLAMGTYAWTQNYNEFRPGLWGTADNRWPMDWWGYFNVYKMNLAIDNIEAGSDVYLDEERNNRLGELYFLRAFAYFEMAKRYGGVPIILETQNPDTTPEDELFPSRNTEKEVYDQVLADTQLAFDLLPIKWPGEIGRASMWAAKALESRVALYAASIAKYGTVQLDGLVGIPSSDANSYYQTSLNASNKIIAEGGFTLFDKYPNKDDNYANLFLDETEDETIFRKIWLPFEKGHSYDLHNVPWSYRVDWGSSLSPTKQLIDSYEMLNTGLLPNEAGSGFDENNPWENRDPRLKGTILTNNDIFQGSPVENWYGTERAGEIDTDPFTGVGKDGYGVTTTDFSQTGFYIRKYLEDGSSPLFIKEYFSGTDCIIFRLGEIYLNAAEAAIELGQEESARDLIEPVRTRAGLKQNLRLQAQSGTDLRDKIRHERKLELAFEDQRYWDVRRWRIATEALSFQVEGVKILRHIDDFGVETFTYETFDAAPLESNFYERHYYLPIGQDRRNNNNKLKENPGY